jgi:transcriptional regulator with XRE-family HTH domain
MSKHVTQRQVADQVAYSEEWISKIERGYDEKFSEHFLLTLATVIKMTATETSLLLSLSPRPARAPEEELQESRIIQWTLDELSCPAFIRDSAWNLLGFNPPMEKWFHWVTGERPNFMQWAFTTVEARTVLHNWGTEWGPQLWAEMQFALGRQPENTKLAALVNEILERSRAARLISEHPLTYSIPDGKRRRVKLPVHGNRIQTVEQRSWIPEAAPASRIVLIVPLDDTQH